MANFLYYYMQVIHLHHSYCRRHILSLAQLVICCYQWIQSLHYQLLLQEIQLIARINSCMTLVAINYLLVCIILSKISIGFVKFHCWKYRLCLLIVTTTEQYSVHLVCEYRTSESVSLYTKLWTMVYCIPCLRKSVAKLLRQFCQILTDLWKNWH